MLNIFEKLMNPTEGTSDYTKGKKIKQQQQKKAWL